MDNNLYLVDEGTLDTVLRCRMCGDVFRFSYDGGDDGDYDYDTFVADCMEVSYDHDCNRRAADALRADGFDLSEPIAECTGGYWIARSQCEAGVRSGVPCHETTCSRAREE